MKILEDYADDRSALEAAITLVESEPDHKAVHFEHPLYGNVFIRLFKEALNEIDASEQKAGLPLDGDRLHAEVVDLARSVLVCAYESQRHGVTT